VSQVVTGTLEPVGGRFVTGLADMAPVEIVARAERRLVPLVRRDIASSAAGDASLHETVLGAMGTYERAHRSAVRRTGGRR